MEEPTDELLLQQVSTRTLHALLIEACSKQQADHAALTLFVCVFPLWWQLETMRLADPEQYAELMALLQQAAGAAATGPAQAPGSKSMDTGSIAAAISQLRSEERTIDSINLPGGKGALTAEGVKPQPKGVRITPEVGFVVKTRLQNSPTKVFINVCKHPQLAEPATKKKLDDDGNEVEGLNIPLRCVVAPAA